MANIFGTKDDIYNPGTALETRLVSYLWRPLADSGYCILWTPCECEKWGWNCVDIYFRSRVVEYPENEKINRDFKNFWNIDFAFSRW